jgi:phosphoglycolate phosphatase
MTSDTPTVLSDDELAERDELAELSGEAGVRALVVEQLDQQLDELDDDFDDEDEDDDESGDIELIVLDMAGTTVVDDGVVERAFALAAERSGIATGDGFDAALQYVRDTMGQSKIEVFRVLADGDEDAAQRANAAFEGAYTELVASEGVAEIEGAADVIRELRAAGASVVLTTGFSPVTRDAIIDALGWHDLADAVLSPADAGRGRPHPDMPLTALLRTGASAVDAMVVVGDTASDVLSGVNAGAGFVVGVLSGAHDRDALEAAGADAVIDSITELPALLGLRGE